MFNEIEKIEVSLRSTLANVVAKETGNIFWMTDGSLSANPNKFNRTMELIDKEVNNSKEDFILHFKSKYSNACPPAWMLVEILPMGVVTRIYENIKSNPLKKKIAALPSCKGMEQTVCHQPYGSTENETSLDKRCRTATQDIL